MEPIQRKERSGSYVLCWKTDGTLAELPELRSSYQRRTLCSPPMLLAPVCVATSASCTGEPPKLRYASRYMKWRLMSSRLSELDAGDGCGTQFRPAQLPDGRGVTGIRDVGERVIDGVVPHVTATLVESMKPLEEGSGPRTISASPAGGGVRLSTSAGRNPYCGKPPTLGRFALSSRAGRPWSILSRSKT